MADASVMEKLVSLCKRRGFVYPASEIYGGLNGFWDYGPLGTLLKNNIRDAWWRDMVLASPIGPDGDPLQIVGIDTAIIQNPRTWVASGHVGGFSDPMVDCRETQNRYRADKLVVWVLQPVEGREQWIVVNDDIGDALAAVADGTIRKRVSRSAARAFEQFVKTGGESSVRNFMELSEAERALALGPDATGPGTLTEPRQFNLMLTTELGAVDPIKAYLRPETAQGIFLNYKNVIDTTRVKVPFGIAQVGKSFRNEVTPRNFIFRSREFEQMELQWFCPPEEALKWYEFWRSERMRWWESLGIKREHLRFRDHGADEMSHYSKATVDVEYLYPFTAPDFGELEGIAHRGAYDLTQHQEHAGHKMEYFDQERNERYLPNVIEPSSGLTRAVLVALCEAYTEDPQRPSGVVMRFDPKIAPIKVGVFPLVNKEGMPELARKLYLELRQRYTCEYDPKQSIGKRYARMDEIGTPYCVTVDGQTLSDQTVTVRHRDSAQQERVALDQLTGFLASRLGQ